MARCAAAALVGALVLALCCAGTLGAQCSALDSDFCAVEPTCFFSYLDGACRDVSCEAYNEEEDRYHMCTLDPYSRGPCVYDQALKMCIGKDESIPCYYYDGDCPKGCVYNATEAFCMDGTMSTPCARFGTCPTDHCYFDSDTYSCVQTGKKPPCSEYYEKDLCLKRTDCRYNSDLSLCWPTDLEVPCDQYFSSAACPTNACELVQTSSDATSSVCVPKGGDVPCGIFGEQGFCESGTKCAWNADAFACHLKQIPVDCDRFAESKCPAANGCVAVGGVCQQAASFDCQALSYVAPGCNSTYGCMRDCDKEYCTICPASGCPPDAPCAGGVTPSTGCTGLAEQQCQATANCYWLSTDICSAEPEVTCNDYYQEADCNAAATCVWNEATFACDPCDPSAGGCAPATTPKTPDTGLPCSTYTADTCPYPRCLSTFDSALGKEICRTTNCIDFYSEGACVGNGCTWSSDVDGACYNKTRGVDCEQLDESTCKTQATCTWYEAMSTCGGKDTQKPCSTYLLEQCPDDRCTPDHDDDSCRPIMCSDLFTEAVCLAAHCKFDEICYNDTGSACGSYTTIGECPSLRCIWDTEGAGAACKQRNCNTNVYAKVACEALKCTWTGSTCYNDTNPSASCSTFSGDDCPIDRCSVVRHGDGTTTCGQSCCSQIYDQSVCTANGCSFNSSTYECYKPSTGACSTLSGCDCDVTRCTFDYDQNICRDPDCSDLYDPSTCAADPTCAWNDLYFLCTGKDGVLPCWVASYSDETHCLALKDATGKSLCEWKNDIMICNQVGTPVPCNDIHTAASCAQYKCVWEPNSESCAHTGQRLAAPDHRALELKSNPLTTKVFSREELAALANHTLTMEKLRALRMNMAEAAKRRP